MFLLCHSDLELNYILTKVFLWLLCLQLIFFPLLLWLKVIGIDCGWLWHLHSISSLKCCCGSVPVVSPAKLLQRYWMSCQCIGCPIQSASKLSAGSAGFNSLVPVMRKQSIFFLSELHASSLHFWNACGDSRGGFSISLHFTDGCIYCNAVLFIFFSFLGAGSNSNLISCNTNLLNFNFILRCCLFEK